MSTEPEKPRNIMNSAGLIIKNGQFYRDGKVVPPVFGDTEQIEVLRRHNGLVEEAKTDGISVTFESEEICRTEEEISFDCICGAPYHDTGEDSSMDSFCGIVKCKSCGLKYEIEFDSSFDLVAKLITD